MARTMRTRHAVTSEAANRLKATVAQMKPFAGSAKAAATRGVRATRRWGAPRIERTGQMLQDNVAPKVASLLSSAAQRLDPGKPRDARWRRSAGIATVTAAASSAAAVVLRRKKPAAASSAAEEENLASATETDDRPATTSADADGRSGAS